MNFLVCFVAINEKKWTLSPCFNGKSARDLALKKALTLAKDSGHSLYALCDNDSKQWLISYENVKCIQKDSWDAVALFQAIADANASENAQCALVCFSEQPLLCLDIAHSLLERHLQYKAEYTYAECYPEGLAPFVIDFGAATLISSSLKSSGVNIEISLNMAMEAITPNINSYEIETQIAPFDYRQYRLKFCTNTKPLLEKCKELFAITQGKDCDIDTLSTLAIKSPRVLCSAPTFYNIQITVQEGLDNENSPWNAFAGSLKSQEMSLCDFATLQDKIAEFSFEATVCISAFGEPTLHKDFVQFVKEICKHEGLKALIETDGISLKLEQVEELIPYDKSIVWIVKALYKDSKLDALAKANVVALSKKFSNVYPEMLRTLDTESYLEAFYRYYSDKQSPTKGKVVIQKYDDFCKLLPEKKSVDLAPLERYPCHHLCHDMTILADGSVPLCRERGKESVANAFCESLPKIWEQNRQALQKHIASDYDDFCKKCDEYYTFNF